MLRDVVAGVRDRGDPDLWEGDVFLISLEFGDGESYGMRLPDRCADLAFVDGKKGFFVEYLRRVFAWGGFPGWERHPKPPRELIRELTRDLLPI